MSFSIIARNFTWKVDKSRDYPLVQAWNHRRVRPPVPAKLGWRRGNVTLSLICVSNQPLTPSDEVDQVWHLHLLYTHSYWIEMCDRLLNKQIHHGPTKGRQSESLKFTDWYLRTIELYKVNFGELPPDDIWPPKEKRFRDVNFQRVNMDNHWVFKKPFS